MTALNRLQGLASSAPSAPLAGRLADMAVAALIDEAMLTPKPGLVDLRGSGAHHDLNWLLMCHSAWALHAAFRAMALAGQEIGDAALLRERIGAIGRDGERAMMAATGGINTHRGAIWALGLLVSAAAQPGARSAADIACRAGLLARLRDRHAPAVTGNKGELACLEHGVGGARAQAQAGFPQVMQVALPMLAASRRRGDGEDAARLNALLAVIGQLDDTCLLARGGAAALAATQAGARAVLDAGGAAAPAGKLALSALERRMLADRLSPGGAADLLAAALLLDRIEQADQKR
ncbi:triphosphoribosyl-dephospho-CoA synthase [Janthinobacterium agaricidamnosum]|uniref:Probable 2-(5''-triphosphoribosyl)-3'-dephosphocoenzyme-A synthase n=1 Tax=Janthinobacterium agaricidamnosum NBRC 102515 = DSM 9628 TaxID=1349767 RepID=W0V7W6_9BURK|nr:triphosphoribosyl-dephospho-CoA synthase [Janthinobacterium agaricidamnosum]CDG83367.1 triphosphoribosyl-dephospho-CoA synthase MdcB [Janthinobacterium agaricidamnosum NBRC 102515 = DSM 9628]